MSEYIIKYDVPILDEHTLTDDDGGTVVEIDRAKLHRIALNNNRRVQETGDETPVVIGHTRDELTENLQPEIVGYASNFRVKPLFKTGRYAVFCRIRFLRDKYSKVRNYPRRSVELWLNRMEVDPISLLGATTPERDLGLLRFSRGDQSYTHILESPMTENVDEVVQKVLAALQQTDVWKFMEQKMNEEEQHDGNTAEDPNAMPPAEGDEDMPALEDNGDNDDVPFDEQKPKKYGASCASGSNTAVPGPVKVKRQRADETPVRYERDQLRIQLSRYQKGLAQVQRENKDLRLKFQRAEREKDLIQLEAEGYQFDRGEELDEVAALEPKSYKRYLDRLKKRYSRAPVGGEITDLTRHARTNTAGGRTKEQAAKIADYAAQKGISYEDALGQMEANKVF